MSEFDHTKIVTLGDISVTKFGFNLKLNWSKTDQNFGRGIIIPLLKASDPALCPILALSDLINILPLNVKSSIVFVGPWAGWTLTFFYYIYGEALA